MQAYRIRRGASERSVADMSALVALADKGELRPTDEVHTPDGWVAAATLPVLRGRLGTDDPWAAWSDVDSVDAASLYKRMVDEPEELPVEAVTPMGASRDGAAAAEPEPLPLDALTTDPPTDPGLRTPPAPVAPPSEHPRSAPPRPPPEDRVVPPPRKEPLPLPPTRATRPAPEPGEAGEVIDFPRLKPAYQDLLTPPPRPPRPSTPPIVRTSRVVAMVVAGLLAVLLGYAWIRVNAFSRAGVEPLGSSILPTKKVVAPAPPSPLVLVDAELRKFLPATPRAVREDGDLADALMVDLTQQRLDVIAADGVVTKWIGRQGDEPKTAEVRIRFRSADDMSRELGAIALVVGRYKRFYRLDIPVFEVTEEGTGGVTRIDPDKAEAYYQARISLEELLASITGKK